MGEQILTNINSDALIPLKELKENLFRRSWCKVVETIRSCVCVHARGEGAREYIEWPLIDNSDQSSEGMIANNIDIVGDFIYRQDKSMRNDNQNKEWWYIITFLH